jgi:hypothetical protein
MTGQGHVLQPRPDTGRRPVHGQSLGQGGLRANRIPQVKHALIAAQEHQHEQLKLWEHVLALQPRCQQFR